MKFSQYLLCRLAATDLVIIGEEPMEIDPGIRTAAAIHDLDQDGYLDLIAGNYSGGLNYFAGAEQPGVIGIRNNEFSVSQIRIYISRGFRVIAELRFCV